jgi:hypothetical protein
MEANVPVINPRRLTGTRRNRQSAPAPLDLEPATAYEAITRQKVESLEDDLSEIKSRVDTIFYLVIGSILVDMLSRWISG